MQKYLVFITIIAGMLVVAACSPSDLQALEKLSANQNTQTQAEQASQVKQGVQLLQQGIDPIEITPGAPRAAGDSSDGGGVISSSGDQSAGVISNSNEAGEIGGAAAGGVVSSNPQIEPAAWLTYSDPQYGYQINYPDIYTILNPIEKLNEVNSRLLSQVRFLETELAKSEVANLEPPKFTVEVYANPGRETLEAFLNTQARDGVREPYQLGSLNGIRVYFNTLMAPNNFYYFTSGDYIYRLIPLGEYSQEMLQSFKLTQ
jgi:hypothetical protein